MNIHGYFSNSVRRGVTCIFFPNFASIRYAERFKFNGNVMGNVHYFQHFPSGFGKKKLQYQVGGVCSSMISIQAGVTGSNSRS